MDNDIVLNYIKRFHTLIEKLKSRELNVLPAISSSESYMVAIAATRYDLIGEEDVIFAWHYMSLEQQETVARFRTDIEDYWQYKKARIRDTSDSPKCEQGTDSFVAVN